MKPVCFLRSADDDLQAAYERYEEYQPGLGDLFSQSVESVLALLSKFPLFGSQFHRQTRKMLVRKFPFAIFYVAESDRIVFHSILDVRLGPSLIWKRFSSLD